MSEIIQINELSQMSTPELINSYRLAEDTAESCIVYMRQAMEELRTRNDLPPGMDDAS